MAQSIDQKLKNLSAKERHLWTMRHSAEHVLMQAMHQLFPGQFHMAMGPATPEGFYFDFQPVGDFKLSDKDFSKIEKQMRSIISQNLPITKQTVSAPEALALFPDNPFKHEWVQEAQSRGDSLTVYWTGKTGEPGSFVDLCAGPHLESTGKIGAIKLLSVAGAYWRGDEKNPMLTRIYGTAFPSPKELDNYLHLLEEAKKRDHRKLGKQLDLFTFSDLVGPGLPLYTPKGALMRRLVNEHVESIQTKHGYQQVWTPQIAKAELFKISGHYDKYKDDMFRVVSNYSKDELYLKPMNCPQHTQIFASQPRSYRDLPYRITDFAMLYRDEKPGELNGLARVRSFSQDDCHVFCTENQVDQEADLALSMTKEIMDAYGFKYRYRLSTRDQDHPEKYVGDPKTWDKVEKWAEKIMIRNRIDHYPGPGEAAFYAPKMDLMATDSLGREWQLSTVQIDFFSPRRFGLTYTDKSGKEVPPVMLHRAIIGSPERFLMILIEHFAGAFPVWLAPVQTVIIPISEKHLTQAQQIHQNLLDQNIRSQIQEEGSMQKRIRTAEKQKIPYMLIIGDKEQADKSVSVRFRGQQYLGSMSYSQFQNRILSEVSHKTIA